MTHISEARVTAQAFVTLIEAYCRRVEVAGSVRRNKPEVKDIEIVAIFEDGWTDYLDALVEAGVITKATYGATGSHRWGQKYRGLVFEGTRIEIFAADESNYGYMLWLRTGPGEANEYVMKHLKATSATIAARGGYWWRGDERLDTPEESDVFALLGIDSIEPINRSEAAYRSAFNSALRANVMGQKADNSRYSMLHPHHAQRIEYESTPPLEWKHRLLPLWVDDIEHSIDEQHREIEARGYENAFSFRLEATRLTRIRDAYLERYQEGVEHGLERFPVLEEKLQEVKTA